MPSASSALPRLALVALFHSVAFRRLGLAHAFDVGVVHDVLVHRVTTLAQHRRLGEKDGILATWLLIEVVDEQDAGLRHGSAQNGTTAWAMRRPDSVPETAETRAPTRRT